LAVDEDQRAASIFRLCMLTGARLQFERFMAEQTGRPSAPSYEGTVRLMVPWKPGSGLGC